MTHRPVLTMLAAAALALSATSACAATTPPRAGTAVTGWEQRADFPLAPREAPIAVWTGREIIVIGGHLGAPCPANASCVMGELTADGAAYDPETDTWREIAAAPEPFAFGTGAFVAGTVFANGVTGAGAEVMLTMYDVDADSWTRLELPQELGVGDDLYQYIPVADGERLVLVSSSDELRDLPDLVFDPTTDQWSELPADPIGPAANRMLTPTRHGLVLTAQPLVPAPGAQGPWLTLAAILDSESNEWTRLPDTGQISGWPWAVDGDRMVTPQIGGADGGQVGNWGREYPFGGVITLPSGDWSPLPAVPRPRESALGDVTGGRYSISGGYLYDDRRRSWTPLDVPSAQAASALWIDDRLFVLGGPDVTADRRTLGETAPDLDQYRPDTWLFTPPADPAG